MPPVFEHLNYDVTDGVATVTLNRPDKMNAMNVAMGDDLIALFDETDRDDDVRAIIITGAGDRAFCAGADLSAGGKTFDYAGQGGDALRDQVGEVVRDGGGILTLRMFESLKPIIGAINGAAVGIGATMQLPMDVRLASATARFGFVFARRGIVPDGAASWFLPRVVGISTALEWTATGRIFDAQEALDRGLVSSIHAPDELLGAARAIAREIAQNTAPVSVAMTRQLMWRMLGSPHPMEAHRIESRAIQSRGASADAREGVTSFLEKRQPAYPDRVSGGLPNVYPGWVEPEFS